MEPIAQPLQFTPDHQAVFNRVALLAGNLGYFVLASSLFTLFVAISRGVTSLPTGRTEDIVAWLSSFLNGNRAIETKWFNELFIEGSFGVLIGLGLVKFSRIWFALFIRLTVIPSISLAG